ncbi:nectin-3-like protein isoform X2 [Antennarius striatus]|uniref:nectin-3-like protein isoform X2 n=1 Tax=Antennarius striatus TaxID=241820 RepID=UPI0035AF0494
MENGPPLSGTFPSGRMRLVVFLLTLYGLTCVSSNKLIVHKKLTAVLGKDIILPCKIEMTDTNFTQSSWQQNFAKNVTVIVVFNPDYGTDYDSKYKNRASLINPSKEDASIILRGVQLSDAGLYTCKMASFPSGMTENSTQLEVIVEPTILLAMGNSPLVNGSRETLVATCIAEHAIPAAEVFWETKVDGRTEKQHQTYLNGTITTRASYYWQPQSIDHEQKLTCVVRHPTLKFDFRSESVLLILYAPVITIYPRDKYWYVGQENVQLTCGARANPPPNLTTWTRLDGVMPKGLEVSNESLVFTRPLRRNDSGIYRCEVTNEIGVRSQDIDLLIQGRPLMSLRSTSGIRQLITLEAGGQNGDSYPDLELHTPPSSLTPAGITNVGHRRTNTDAVTSHRSPSVSSSHMTPPQQGLVKRRGLIIITHSCSSFVVQPRSVFISCSHWSSVTGYGYI